MRAFTIPTTANTVKNPKRDNSGFTLVELMIVLAIAAILLIAAGPSYQTFIRSQRLDTAANDYAFALRQARSEAIKSNSNVQLCAANDDRDGCASSSTSLENGWLVVRQLGGVTTVLASREAVANGLRISTQNSTTTFDQLGSPDPESPEAKFCAIQSTSPEAFFPSGKLVKTNAGGQSKVTTDTCP